THGWFAVEPNRNFFQMCPRWSPSGARLAFPARSGGAGYGIYTVGVDGAGLARVRDTGQGLRPLVDWSPDGGRLLFEPFDGSEWSIWTMNPDGGDARQISLLRAFDYDLRFTPEGTRLYGPIDVNFGTRISVTQLDGSDWGYVGVATETGAIHDYMEPDWVVPTVRPPPPPPQPPPPAAADAGGPYQAVAGSPLQLSAGASGLAAAEIPRAAWDLDGDGQFDDAVGLQPTVTFAAAGTTTVAVRLTTFGGATATSAPANVSIGPAPLVLLPSPHVTALAGQVASLRLASISSAGAGPGATAYEAAIDWGDGSVGPGTVTQEHVEGAHTYGTPGERLVAIGACVSPQAAPGAGPCAETTVAVTVVASLAENRPPAAADVAVATAVATRVSVPLAGDDPDGNPLEFHLSTAGTGLPLHGKAVQLPDGMVAYTPDPSF